MVELAVAQVGRVEFVVAQTGRGRWFLVGSGQCFGRCPDPEFAAGKQECPEEDK